MPFLSLYASSDVHPCWSCLLSSYYTLVVLISACGTEKKREVYDRYGKDGVHGDTGFSDDDFATNGHNFHFQFRSPEEIFRDFFGTDDPFSRIFGG